jgi:hypothetical protein
MINSPGILPDRRRCISNQWPQTDRPLERFAGFWLGSARSRIDLVEATVGINATKNSWLFL